MYYTSGYCSLQPTLSVVQCSTLYKTIHTVLLLRLLHPHPYPFFEPLDTQTVVYRPLVGVRENLAGEDIEVKRRIVVVVEPGALANKCKREYRLEQHQASPRGRF